jgi:hypothetical protein
MRETLLHIFSLVFWYYAGFCYHTSLFSFMLKMFKLLFPFFSLANLLFKSKLLNIYAIILFWEVYLLLLISSFMLWCWGTQYHFIKSYLWLICFIHIPCHDNIPCHYMLLDGIFFRFLLRMFDLWYNLNLLFLYFL